MVTSGETLRVHWLVRSTEYVSSCLLAHTVVDGIQTFGPAQRPLSATPNRTELTGTHQGQHLNEIESASRHVVLMDEFYPFLFIVLMA